MIPMASHHKKQLPGKSLVAIIIAALLGASGCQVHTSQQPMAQTGTTSANPVTATPTTRFTALMNEIWHYRLSYDPIKANDSDNNDYNHKLKNLSAPALIEHNRRLTAYTTQLNAIDRQQLSDEDVINLDILLRQVKNDIDKYHFKHHYMPIKAESGFHTEMAYLPRIVPFKTEQDYVNYLSRLKAMPTFFEQNITWLKQGISSGFTQPQVILQGFEKGIEAFIVDDPAKSLYYGPFKKKPPGDTSPARFAELQNEAKNIIAQQLVPIYQNFHQFMVKTYIPQARKTVGLGNTPNGVEYYNNRANHFTTTDKTAEQIHQLGLQEVARIRSEMEQIIKKLDFKGSFADFIHFLRTDKQFYATTPEQLLKEASYIAKKMDAKLPSLFKHLPRSPYGVAPVPDHLAPKYTTGRYLNPSQDDQPGYYWVNTYALDRRPLYVLEALTLHEAVPGHHLQNSINRELASLPPHRRYEYLSAFGEGWGLYSEYLGIEAGFYQDPYSDFGRLTYEMWRACRLVVDTGMHIKGWSRQQAIDLLSNNTALSMHNVITEVDRYIAWPGQALSYKMGELTIKRLRGEAQAALGEKFDVREFHDEVLKHGAVPMAVLEAQIKAYIDQVLAHH